MSKYGKGLERDIIFGWERRRKETLCEIARSMRRKIVFWRCELIILCKSSMCRKINSDWPASREAATSREIQWMNRYYDSPSWSVGRSNDCKRCHNGKASLWSTPHTPLRGRYNFVQKYRESSGNTDLGKNRNVIECISSNRIVWSIYEWITKYLGNFDATWKIYTSYR